MFGLQMAACGWYTGWVPGEGIPRFYQTQNHTSDASLCSFITWLADAGGAEAVVNHMRRKRR